MVATAGKFLSNTGQEAVSLVWSVKYEKLMTFSSDDVIRVYDKIISQAHNDDQWIPLNIREKSWKSGRSSLVSHRYILLSWFSIGSRNRLGGVECSL